MPEKAREPPGWVGDQRIQVPSRCHSGVFANVRSVGDAPERDACPTTPYNAGTPRQPRSGAARDATTAALGAQQTSGARAGAARLVARGRRPPGREASAPTRAAATAFHR